MEKLIQLALENGACGACIVSQEHIVLSAEFRDICRFENA